MLIGTGVPDYFANGLPYEAIGAVAAALTTPTHFHQGLGFDAEDRLCVVATDPDNFGSGAAPFVAATPGRLCIQEAAVNHFSSGVGYTAGGRVAIIDAVAGLYSGTALVAASGSNFVIGTNTASDPVPSTIGALDIFYLGSFGQFFWNLRMGDGTEQIPGVDSVTVTLGAAGPATLPWNAGSMKYQATTAQDLWAVIGADLGNTVDWIIDTR